MINVKEKELKKFLKDFKNKDITIEFNDGLEGKIKIKNASIIYDEKKGYINIIGKENNQKLKINTTIIYRYMTTEKYESLEIRIDSQVALRIIKC